MSDHVTVDTKLFYPEDLPQELFLELNNSPDHVCIKGHQIYLLMNGMIICCPDNDNGQQLISSIIQHTIRTFRLPAKKEEVFASILFNPYYYPEENLLKKYRIVSGTQRCVVVFRSFSPLKSELFSTFSSIVPTEKNDTIIPSGYQTVILVKTMQNVSVAELTEYTDAVIGSMETEGISGIKAGIGSVVTDIKEIRNSYLEACRSLIIGTKYHHQDHVFIYQRQMLEKIIESIPPEKRKALKQGFFKTIPSGKLSDEMFETVRVFFQNDLNLTAASRQLFIHRNTLNYRLDKIKKDFGLDLRSFHDAVIFKILSEIQEEK